jgi:hypothetical protein
VEKVSSMKSEEQRNLDLVVTLAVIVGHCNVLYDMLEDGSQQARRLATIRGMAASAMKGLTEQPGTRHRIPTPAVRRPATEESA